MWAPDMECYQCWPGQASKSGIARAEVWKSFMLNRLVVLALGKSALRGHQDLPDDGRRERSSVCQGQGQEQVRQHGLFLIRSKKGLLIILRLYLYRWYGMIYSI